MQNYSELPDILSADELATHFESLLSTEASLPEQAEGLFELAQRQYETYSPLDASLKSKLENWVKQRWTTDVSVLTLNHFLSGIITLKLDGMIESLEKSLQADQTPEDLKEAISEALEEYREPEEVF